MKTQCFTQEGGGCSLGLHQSWPAEAAEGNATVERRLHRVTRCVIRSKRLKE